MKAAMELTSITLFTALWIYLYLGVTI